MRIRAIIDRWARKRMSKLYGEPPDNEKSVGFRCLQCYRPVTWARIATGKCVCGGIKVKPGYYTLWEELKLLFLPFIYR